MKIYGLSLGAKVIGAAKLTVDLSPTFTTEEILICS